MVPPTREVDTGIASVAFTLPSQGPVPVVVPRERRTVGGRVTQKVPKGRGIPPGGTGVASPGRFVTSRRRKAIAPGEAWTIERPKGFPRTGGTPFPFSSGTHREPGGAAAVTFASP